MKIAIGPKGHQTMIRVLFHYCGSGKRWGRSKFANGYSLRLGLFHMRIWWPRGNDLGSDYAPT
jgi:hypothetical protein